MSQTAHESRDPRTYRDALPNVTPKEHREAKVAQYQRGYLDAVQVTAKMPDDKAGRRAVSELAAGNAKPYRRLADRRNPLG